MILLTIAFFWLLMVLVGVPIGIAMIFVSMGYFYYMDRGIGFAM